MMTGFTPGRLLRGPLQCLKSTWTIDFSTRCHRPHNFSAGEIRETQVVLRLNEENVKAVYIHKHDKKV